MLRNVLEIDELVWFQGFQMGGRRKNGAFGGQPWQRFASVVFEARKPALKASLLLFERIFDV